MAQRLIDTYQPEQLVEVLFTVEDETEWRRARVVALDHPGIWVRTEADKKLWFVTNGKRIRPWQQGTDH